LDEAIRALDVKTLQRYNNNMNTMTKRSTIYFSSELHHALRMKAAATHNSISDIVNEAVKQILTEDLEDLTAFTERANEPNLDFEDVLEELKTSGKI